MDAVISHYKTLSCFIPWTSLPYQIQSGGLSYLSQGMPAGPLPALPFQGPHGKQPW